MTATEDWTPSAAYVEAHRRWPEGYDSSATQHGFTEGAKWVAERLLSDESVEAACAGFYNDVSGLTNWDRLAKSDPILAEKYRVGQRAALTAALAEITKEQS